MSTTTDSASRNRGPAPPPAICGRPRASAWARVLLGVCAATASLLAHGQTPASPRALSTVSGSCDGYANYADELLPSNFRVVSQTDQGDGTSQVQITFSAQNSDIGEFSGATFTPDLDALAAQHGVITDSVVPATLGAIAALAPEAVPATDLVLRLPTANITNLLARLNDGSVPVTVHANEVAVPVPGYEVIHWTGLEDAYYRYIELEFGTVPRPPPPYGNAQRFEFRIGYVGASRTIFDKWVPGSRMYLTELPSEYAVQYVPPLLRNGRIVGVKKETQGSLTTWAITIQRTLDEDLPSLFTSASFCSGPITHIDDPVHASRLYSLDGQPQAEGTRDKRGQPLRFNDLRIGDNLTISGQIQGHILKPEVEIRLRNGQPRLVATFDTDMSFSAEARAAAEFNAAGDGQLYKLCFPIATIPAGPVAIDVNLQLEHFAGFEGRLAAEAVMAVQKRFRSRNFVGFDARRIGAQRFFSGSTDLSPPMDFTPPQLTDDTQAYGSVYTRVRPTLRIGAQYPDCETGFGAWTEIKAFGSLNVTPTQSPWWTLGAGMDLYGGLNVSLWGLDVAQWESNPVRLLSAQTRDSNGGPLLPPPPGATASSPGRNPVATGGARVAGLDQRWAVAIDDLDTPNGFNKTSVAPTADQGVVVASHELIGGGARLIRLDNQGAFQWSRRYNTTLSTRKVMVLPDDNLLVAGSPNWLARHDANGNAIWNRSYQVGPAGSSQFSGCSIKDAALLRTTAGQYDVVMVGETSGDTSPRACAQRIDANGNLLWAKGYDGANLQKFHAVVVAADGRIAVAGRWDGITPIAGFGDILKQAAFIGKLDAATGQPVWGKRLSTSLYRGGELFDMVETADGNLLAVGNMLGIVTQDGGGLLARIAADGTDARHALLTHDQDWEAELDYETPPPLNISYFDNYDTLYAITPMADGFAVAGRTRLATADQGEGSWLLKMNAQLGVEWFSTMEGSVNDSFDAVAFTGDSLLVTGWSASLAGLGQPPGENWLTVAKYPINGRLQLLPQLKGLNMRYLQPGVRDSGNDPLVSNPGVTLDAQISVEDLEVRSVTSLPNVFTTPSRLCVNKLTETGAISTLDACASYADFTDGFESSAPAPGR